MHSVSESIFDGATTIIPMADVQNIEKCAHNSVPGIRIITKHTRWDSDRDDWTNSIWLSEPEAASFCRAWCTYRSELEADTLMDLRPDAISTQSVMARFDSLVHQIKGETP